MSFADWANDFNCYDTSNYQEFVYPPSYLHASGFNGMLPFPPTTFPPTFTPTFPPTFSPTFTPPTGHSPRAVLNMAGDGDLMLGHVPPTGYSPRAVLNMAGDGDLMLGHVPPTGYSPRAVLNVAGDGDLMLGHVPPTGYSPRAVLNVAGDGDSMLGHVVSDIEPGHPTGVSSFAPVQMYTLAPSDPSPQESFAPQAQLETHTSPAGQGRATPTPTPTVPNPDASKEPAPKRRRGPRKKVPSEAEVKEKKENGRERNRFAASKCRLKRKRWEQQMIELLALHSQEGQLLWQQVASLQNDLDSIRTFTLSIANSSGSDDFKSLARTAMDAATSLQHAIDDCNNRRGEMCMGYIMERTPGGYVQRDSMQGDPEQGYQGLDPDQEMSVSASVNGQGEKMDRTDSGFASSSGTPIAAKEELPVDDEAIDVPNYVDGSYFGAPFLGMFGDNAAAQGMSNFA